MAGRPTKIIAEDSAGRQLLADMNAMSEKCRELGNDTGIALYLYQEKIKRELKQFKSYIEEAREKSDKLFADDRDNLSEHGTLHGVDYDSDEAEPAVRLETFSIQKEIRRAGQLKKAMIRRTAVMRSIKQIYAPTETVYLNEEL